MNKDYTTAGERGVATRLVRAAIKAGFTVSVNDGEEWTVKRSDSEAVILPALATTGYDTLRFRSSAGDYIGSAFLVWGNEESGECLISDHTDNDIIGSLVQQADRNV